MSISRMHEQSDPERASQVRIETKRRAIGLDIEKSLSHQEMVRFEPLCDLADEVLDKGCKAKGTQDLCLSCHTLGLTSIPMCRRIADSRAVVEESLQRQDQVANLTADVPPEPSPYLVKID